MTVTFFSPAASFASSTARSTPSVTKVNGTVSASSGGSCVTMKNGQPNGSSPPHLPESRCAVRLYDETVERHRMA
jgi:hypothetical protein